MLQTLTTAPALQQDDQLTRYQNRFNALCEYQGQLYDRLKFARLWHVARPLESSSVEIAIAAEMLRNDRNISMYCNLITAYNQSH